MPISSFSFFFLGRELRKKCMIFVMRVIESWLGSRLYFCFCLINPLIFFFEDVLNKMGHMPETFFLA